jgi:plasmid maintenance system antidote protein VapI
MARTPIHPGEILRDELQETGTNDQEASQRYRSAANRLYQLLAKKRAQRRTQPCASANTLVFGRFMDEPPERL